jgi:rod shape-determining protein MreC
MRNNRGLISFVLVAVVVLLNLPLPASMRVKSSARDSVAGYQNVWHLVVNDVSRTFSAFAGAKKHINQKEELLQEVANLEFSILQMERFEAQNVELRKQLDLQKASKLELVLCEVVSRGGAGGWWQTITLNKGSEDGIEQNRAVVTRVGLVGTTINVAKNSCEVLLLYDSNCQVACRFSRTGSLGILRGAGMTLRGNPEMEMLLSAESPVVNYVRRDQQLIDGDEVVTSGLGGVYPPGLLVGTMKKLSLDAKELYYCVEINPAEDMRELKYVFVVKEKSE